MKKIHIDLKTLAGNPYALMVLVQRLCHQLELGEVAAQDIIHDMQKGTFADPLNVLEKGFPRTFEFLGDPRPRKNDPCHFSRVNDASPQKASMPTKMRIDLGAPEGNALELGGITYRVARQCGLSEKAARDILSDMRAGTYIDLLNVMDREFPGLFEFQGDPRVKQQLRARRNRTT